MSQTSSLRARHTQGDLNIFHGAQVYETIPSGGDILQPEHWEKFPKCDSPPFHGRAFSCTPLTYPCVSKTLTSPTRDTICSQIREVERTVLSAAGYEVWNRPRVAKYCLRAPSAPLALPYAEDARTPRPGSHVSDHARCLLDALTDASLTRGPVGAQCRSSYSYGSHRFAESELCVAPRNTLDPLAFGFARRTFASVLRTTTASRLCRSSACRCPPDADACVPSC
eukprot:1191294-Prorocentrum_minimum.AAC.3